MTDVVSPPGWVPVERRFLGMDRRSLVPAIVVALFGAMAFWGVPALNGAVALEDPVEAGDVVQLGTTVTFAPAAGWNLQSGLRQGEPATSGYPGTAQLTRNAVLFTVIADEFDGTPKQLLAQIRDTNERTDPDSALTLDGQETTFTTTGGEHGVLSSFSSGSGIGLIAAFVFDGAGVEVVAYGPTTVDGETQRDLVSMLESVQPLDAQSDGDSS